ncbi:DUF72 domain-containing protein [Brevibacillus humidisoli]|uniref:DUF72 domain-containing protein n=1 Tax=Brevibacillus humidisoli TaxID=2895522 RepID=UPI001E62894D|nr:DUF72 domain-containing protein [Brevibacillus humidisoli]UFJ39713.1 DUF72 domain-containing protein [Brevibacillus humidisoli]
MTGKISIGVCGWGDHDDLYTQGVKPKEKLSVYASHFPIVELDSSFYAILPQKNYETWVQDTPDRFGFIVKPYQAMTGHQRGAEVQTTNREELFHRFEESIQPLVSAGKLKALLFQFPPWFDLQREHVNYVQWCVRSFADYPVAVEFRHRSWFAESYREKTLSLLRTIGAIHVVCDEPQVGSGCVPIVPEVTHQQLALVRFHGRNVAGWRDPGPNQNWREVRYLYKYSEAELAEWCPRIEQLAEKTKEVCVLFNNNSGGDAVGNAKRMMDLLDAHPEGLNPRQMELF